MVKHAQTILRLTVGELFECVWPFCGLAFKGLTTTWKSAETVPYLEGNKMHFLAKKTDMNGPRFHGNCIWTWKLFKSCSKRAGLSIHA